MLHLCASLILLNTHCLKLNNPFSKVACCAEPCTRAAGLPGLFAELYAGIQIDPKKQKKRAAGFDTLVETCTV
jgi:hypothetical protein